MRALSKEMIYINRVLSQKYGIKYGDMLKITNNSFRELTDTMKDGIFDRVRMPYIGMFVTKERRYAKKGSRKNKNNI